MAKGGISRKYLLQPSFDMCVLYSKNRNNLKLKVRSEFSNVRGEYTHHGNPYIQGTTVSCDITNEEATILALAATPRQEAFSQMSKVCLFDWNISPLITRH